MLFRTPARFLLAILAFMSITANFAMATTPFLIKMTVYFHQGQTALEEHQVAKILDKIKHYQRHDVVALNVLVIGWVPPNDHFNSDEEKRRSKERLDWLVNLLVNNGVPKEIIYADGESNLGREELVSQVDIEPRLSISAFEVSFALRYMLNTWSGSIDIH